MTVRLLLYNRNFQSTNKILNNTVAKLWGNTVEEQS